MIKHIWTTAGFCFHCPEIQQKKKKLSALYLRLTRTSTRCSLPTGRITTCRLTPPLSFSFNQCCFPSRWLCFSALFVGVLEKSVEGEAAALTKAKTLYKSCTNESESAGAGRHRFFLVPALSVLKGFVSHTQLAGLLNCTSN